MVAMILRLDSSFSSLSLNLARRREEYLQVFRKEEEKSGMNKNPSLGGR